MNVFRWSATALIISAALATAAPADADGDSYIRYLNDHGTFVPGINDAVQDQSWVTGMHHCTTG